MKRPVTALFAASFTLAACNGLPASSPTAHYGAAALTHRVHPRYTSPIQHVIIMVQENRTPDNLFHYLKGADIAEYALDKKQLVKLTPMSMAAKFDLNHSHAGYLLDYNNGKMDGFGSHLTHKNSAFGPFHYVPYNEAKPYLEMARQYAFADRMFQTNQSGSFPSHQYLVSGDANAEPDTPWEVSSNAYASKVGPRPGTGCDANRFSYVKTINPYDGTDGPTPYPCFDRPALSDLLDSQGVSWKYYQHELGPGLWHAYDAIQHVRYGPDYANVIPHPEQILTDIKNGQLPGVSWVMPADAKHSDHPGSESSEGPSWISAVVNAVGQSQYWDSTAIFVTWDDWGGWYDHVAPPQMNNYYELGFRLPLLMISPYAKPGYISHDQHEFASILNFAEETFGIPKGSLGSTDVRADDLMDAFDFTQTPIAFTKIKSPPFHPVVKSKDPPDDDPDDPYPGEPDNVDYSTR
ncbi:MAG TPA: alkaline phosphatase family protein [Candidatus Tumulicola sp.]|jgi:phospholipase C